MEQNVNVTDKVSEILSKYEKGDKTQLIQILNIVQNEFGYIPEEALNNIADYLDISRADVYGVITFYSRFTLTPKGKYNIAVCLGTACYVKGSQKILDRVKERLGIDEGETTKDGMFSIEEMRCVGACGLAPVFTINGKVYGNATVQMLDQVLDDLVKAGENS